MSSVTSATRASRPEPASNCSMSQASCEPPAKSLSSTRSRARAVGRSVPPETAGSARSRRRCCHQYRPQGRPRHHAVGPAGHQQQDRPRGAHRRRPRRHGPRLPSHAGRRPLPVRPGDQRRGDRRRHRRRGRGIGCHAGGVLTARPDGGTACITQAPTRSETGIPSEEPTDARPDRRHRKKASSRSSSSVERAPPAVRPSNGTVYAPGAAEGPRSVPHPRSLDLLQCNSIGGRSTVWRPCRLRLGPLPRYLSAADLATRCKVGGNPCPRPSRTAGRCSRPRCIRRRSAPSPLRREAAALVRTGRSWASVVDALAQTVPLGVAVEQGADEPADAARDDSGRARGRDRGSSRGVPRLSAGDS